MKMTQAYRSHLVVILFQSLNVAKRMLVSSWSLNVTVGYKYCLVLSSAILLCFVLCYNGCRRLVPTFVSKVCKEKLLIEEDAAFSFLLFPY